MKIVAIVGSLRRGNTYAMVEAAVHALGRREVELIHLKNLDIKMCNGCLSCDKKRKCHINDNMKVILPKIAAADGFIFGTPSRWSLLSGELKVFFDRLNPLAVPELLKGKKAVIFAVGQTVGKEAETIKLAADSVRFFCENAGIVVVDTVIAKGCTERNDLIAKHPTILLRCKRATLKLYNSLA
jgi:multimeric flavodoxin WrbA